MISPFTKPGTKVVCIDDEPHGKYVAPGYRGKGGMDGLKKGEIYTVAEIVNHPVVGLFVELQEIKRERLLGLHLYINGFSLRRFRNLELPKCLTEILHSAPVDRELV